MFMKKGYLVSGAKAFERRGHLFGTLNYHAADKNGRLYYCGCAKCFRIGGKPYLMFSLKGRFKFGKPRL